MQDRIRIAVLLSAFSFQLPLLGLLPNIYGLRANTKQQRNQLQLDVGAIGQRLCEVGGGGKGNLQLDLQLVFTNSSEDHLILYKFSYDIVRFMISRSLEDIEARRFEMDATQTIVTDDKPLKIDDETFDKYFTVIAPRESYKTKAKLLIPISWDTHNKKPGYLTAGQYVLQIKVRTWPEPNISPIRFKERWRNFGKLWSDHIVSLPMHFKIGDGDKREKCDK